VTAAWSANASDPAAVEAIELFVTYLGRVAGDLALVFMARGGVFLAGGIVQKIIPALNHPRFREAFEDKAPHRQYPQGDPDLRPHPPACRFVGPGRLRPHTGSLWRRNQRPTLEGIGKPLSTRYRAAVYRAGPMGPNLAAQPGIDWRPDRIT
jgi:hypothetical protein